MKKFILLLSLVSFPLMSFGANATAFQEAAIKAFEQDASIVKSIDTLKSEKKLRTVGKPLVAYMGGSCKGGQCLVSYIATQALVPVEATSELTIKIVAAAVLIDSKSAAVVKQISEEKFASGFTKMLE